MNVSSTEKSKQRMGNGMDKAGGLFHTRDQKSYEYPHRHLTPLGVAGRGREGGTQISWKAVTSKQVDITITSVHSQKDQPNTKSPVWTFFKIALLKYCSRSNCSCCGEGGSSANVRRNRDSLLYHSKYVRMYHVLQAPVFHVRLRSISISVSNGVRPPKVYVRACAYVHVISQRIMRIVCVFRAPPVFRFRTSNRLSLFLRITRGGMDPLHAGSAWSREI